VDSKAEYSALSSTRSQKNKLNISETVRDRGLVPKDHQ